MNLAVELAVSIVLLVLVTVIHGTGINTMDRWLRTSDRDFGASRLVQREVAVMIPMALFLLALHILEIFIFAIFYMATGDAANMHEALYHSGLAYTTMGVMEGGITKWMIVSVFEGLSGFLMIGWSSAVFVTDMDRLLRHRNPPPPKS